MLVTCKAIHKRRKGIVLIMSMIFLAVFSVLAVSMAAMSGVNTEVASNQQKINTALAAAQSGIECGMYYASTVPNLPSTSNNTVSSAEATTVWNTFSSYVRGNNPDGQTVPADTTFTDAHGSGKQLTVPVINLNSDNNSNFVIRFYMYNNDPNIYLESVGSDGGASRKITVRMSITKSAEVLKYAVATRSRMWLTGDSTIHGDIYSAWNLSKSQLTTLASNPSALASMTAPSISPFNVSSDSVVQGSINTCWSKSQIEDKSWQLETLDEYGNPVYDESGNKIISSADEIQGQCDGINYGIPPQDMAGMSISDYDTTVYKNATLTTNGGNGNIPYSTSATNYTGSLNTLGDTNGGKYRYEYFPHSATSYTTDRPGGGGIYVKRYIYKNQTFDNVTLPKDKNALFINCTFDGVLYVDSGTTTSNYNNVRFDNCTFNGTIVSNTPQTFNWQKNCLYFTGSATFQNETSSDATILAPHFNVNLGNSNPVSGTDNILRGAIVGGIVDVRGNAEVFGTIISMADTSSYTSGYVTNIGATLEDGGSETVSIGDIGTINITPDEDKLLPSGVTSPIVIKPLQGTYTEG
jgi:hypothetical protein